MASNIWQARPACGLVEAAVEHGLSPAHVRAQLEDLRDTSLTSELNFSIFGPHPRANLGYMQLKLSGKGQSKPKLSRNGNECKHLPSKSATAATASMGYGKSAMDSTPAPLFTKPHPFPGAYTRPFFQINVCRF